MAGFPDIIRCIAVQELAFAPFVSGLVLCFVFAFYAEKERTVRRWLVISFVLYVICELWATLICRGHISAILPMYIGAFSLGGGLSFSLFCLGRYFGLGRRKKDHK